MTKMLKIQILMSFFFPFRFDVDYSIPNLFVSLPQARVVLVVLRHVSVGLIDPA